MFDLGGGIFLSMTPEDTFAGRDISFALSGLTPWQPVRVSFIDPQGVAAAWITADDLRLVDQNGSEATSFLMYPTASGQLDWERYGIQDEAGAWSVDIDLGGSVSSTTYTLDELHLGGQETVSVGAELTRHSGLSSTVYYSDLVPTALVVDLQEYLSDSALLLERRTGTEMGQLPDLYLLANRDLMDQVGAATGVDLGFEDGYYKSFGTRPGIYMRTDLLTTEVRRLLVHEYVHLVFDDLANQRTLPAWLTEGLSRYYEFDVALSGPRANATLLRKYSASDLARAAAQSDGLFSLATLESQSDWNSSTDRDQLSLQYAEAYMAVRYLNETYGPLSGKEAVVDIGLGFGLPHAIETVTGLKFDTFETEFRRWLEKWEDSVRASIAGYLASLEPLLADQDAILGQRARDIDTSMTAGESAISRAFLVNSTEALIVGLRSLSPPEGALALHQEAEEYFERIFDWLTLEFQHADTLDDSKRVAANAMIPEIDARGLLFQRNKSDLQFVLHLGE